MLLSKDTPKLNRILQLALLFAVLILPSCNSEETTSSDELGLSGTVWVYINTTGEEKVKSTLTFSPENVSISTVKNVALDNSGAIISTFSYNAIYKSFSDKGIEYVSFNSEKYIIDGESMKSIDNQKEYIKK